MTAPLPLTPRQLACLRVIQDMTDAGGGVAPSLDRLASQLGTAKGNTHRLVSLLVEKGYVERLAYRARGIRLLHRLSPTPPAAVAELIRLLATAVPSPDGYVSILMPHRMITDAAAALAAAGAP